MFGRKVGISYRIQNRAPGGIAVTTAGVKPVWKIVGIVVGVLILLVIALPLFINVNNFRPEIESNLSSALGRQVKVGDLSLSILSGSVKADNLTIADDPKFSNSAFIQAKALAVGAELLPLILSKKLNVTKIVIDHPEIFLLRNKEGVWNFSSIGGQTNNTSAQPAKNASNSNSSSNINIAKLDVNDGTVTVGSSTGKRKPIVYNSVNITMRDFSFTTSFPVTASVGLPSGGSLKIEGKAGPINPADAALTPVEAKIKMSKLDLGQSALVDPTLGITGMADFDGTLTSDGHIAKASGTVKASSLKLVPAGKASEEPVTLVFAVDHDLNNETGKINQGDISAGEAAAKLVGTYNMKGETTAIQTKLAGQNMPVDDVEKLLPAFGVVLPSGSQLKGGTLSADINSNGPLDKLVSSGWIKMNNTALAGFNLGSKLGALSSLTGKQPSTGNDTQIQNLSSDVRYAPDGTRLDKIDLVIPALGTVTGAGTISPSNQLNFKLVANLSGAAGGLEKMAGMGSGSGGIPINVTGTTSNPSFMPDMKGVMNSKLKGLIPSGVGGKSNPLGGLGGLLGKKPQPQ
jgi:AsmA protein